MEMFVSLAHEIPVEEKDKEEKQEPTEAQKQALARQEQQRILDTYGIDATKEEIEKGEEDRKRIEEEQAAGKRTQQPEDLGKFKANEELTATDIQTVHDHLNRE